MRLVDCVDAHELPLVIDLPDGLNVDIELYSIS